MENIDCNNVKLFVPLTDGEKEVGMVKELKENKIYSRGNHKDFTTFLQKQTNKDNPKVKKLSIGYF